MSWTQVDSHHAPFWTGTAHLALLTQPRITWEETLKEGLSTLGCPLGRSSRGIMLTKVADVERHSPLWVAPSHKLAYVWRNSWAQASEHTCTGFSHMLWRFMFLPHSLSHRGGLCNVGSKADTSLWIWNTLKMVLLGHFIIVDMKLHQSWSCFQDRPHACHRVGA